jgi:hypothetical protein
VRRSASVGLLLEESTTVTDLVLTAGVQTVVFTDGGDGRETGW